MDTPVDPSELDVNPEHMAKAVTELGGKQAVVADCAICNAQGVKIIDQGAVINQTLYERLTQHKLAAPLENCVTASNAVTGESLRRDAEATLAHLPVYARMGDNPKTRALILDAIKAMPLPGPMALQLTMARDLHPAVYQHLLRTALAAAWLTISPLVPRFDVNAAAMAGMLHDIGMLHVDPVLIDSGSPPTREQQRQLFAHPLVSTALIERHHQYPKEVVRAVREHHEFLDGSGYPRNLMGEAISPLGRRLALAQLMSATLTRQASAPEMRLSVLLRINTQRYDPACVAQILALLKPESSAESFAYVPEPIKVLNTLFELLAQWPAELAEQPNRTTHQRDDLQALGSQAARVQRGLANAGLAPDQLALLGEDLDDTVRLEMSLLIRESAWQLRTLGRQARRRWTMDNPPEAAPDALHAWADAVEAAVTDVIGQTPMSTEAPPAKPATTPPAPPQSAAPPASSASSDKPSAATQAAPADPSDAIKSSAATPSEAVNTEESKPA